MVFLVLIRVFGNRIVDKSFSYLQYEIREAICFTVGTLLDNFPDLCGARGRI